jgi:hypothetical protein
MESGSSSSCSDLRLQPEDVAVLHKGLGQRLRILDLSPRVLVVEFVAERGAVGPVRGQAQFLYQNGDDFVTRRVIGKFHGNALVLGGVVDGDVDRRHSYVPVLLVTAMHLLTVVAWVAAPRQIVVQALLARAREVPG